MVGFRPHCDQGSWQFTTRDVRLLFDLLAKGTQQSCALASVGFTRAESRGTDEYVQVRFRGFQRCGVGSVGSSFAAFRWRFAGVSLAFRWGFAGVSFRFVSLAFRFVSFRKIP